MFDTALKLYSTMLATMAAPKDEKGQGTLEYVGIVIVAAILVIAVVDALGNGGTIKTAITTQIDKIIAKGA